jgi:hypothetical protein
MRKTTKALNTLINELGKEYKAHLPKIVPIAQQLVGFNKMKWPLDQSGHFIYKIINEN